MESLRIFCFVCPTPQRVDSGAHHTALYRAVVGQMFADMIRLTDGRVRCVTCENRVVKL